jgi:hypothetical protein
MMKCGSVVNIPSGIVDEIVDYIDYEKYHKIEHRHSFEIVLREIRDISIIMDPISPYLVFQCWGGGMKIV